MKNEPGKWDGGVPMKPKCTDCEMLLAALENALNVLAGLATGQLKEISTNSPAIGMARRAIAQVTA